LPVGLVALLGLLMLALLLSALWLSALRPRIASFVGVAGVAATLVLLILILS